MSKADTPQPLPTIGHGCIQDLATRDILCWEHPMSEFVARDLQARKDVGFKKYGTLLQAHNGRDAIVDAYQEVLDLLNYLRQAIEEGKRVDREYGAAQSIALTLRAML